MQKYTHQKTGIKTCTAALLVITPNWKQLKKSSLVEWVNCVHSYKWTGCNENKWTSTIPNTIRNLIDVTERKTQESTYLCKVQKWAKQKHGIRSKDSSYSWRSSGCNWAQGGFWGIGTILFLHLSTRLMNVFTLWKFTKCMICVLFCIAGDFPFYRRSRIFNLFSYWNTLNEYLLSTHIYKTLRELLGILVWTTVTVSTFTQFTLHRILLGLYKSLLSVSSSFLKKKDGDLGSLYLECGLREDSLIEKTIFAPSPMDKDATSL